MNGWMIRKETGGEPFDTKPASIVGPDTQPIGVVPATQLTDLREAARGLMELIEDYRHDFELETGRLASLSVSLFHEAIGTPGGLIPALRSLLPPESE